MTTTTAPQNRTHFQAAQSGEVRFQVVGDPDVGAWKRGSAHEQHAENHEGQGRRHPHRLHVTSECYCRHTACTSQVNVTVDTPPARHK